MKAAYAAALFAASSCAQNILESHQKIFTDSDWIPVPSPNNEDDSMMNLADGSGGVLDKINKKNVGIALASFMLELISYNRLDSLKGCVFESGDTI